MQWSNSLVAPSLDDHVQLLDLGDIYLVYDGTSEVANIRNANKIL